MQYEILDDLGIISQDEKGYTKKLVLCQWYDKPAAYEVRTFGPDGTPKKRAGLTPEEFEVLKELINSL